MSFVCVSFLYSYQLGWVINKLIPFLDVQAVSELAKAYQFTAQVLQQSSKTWGQLVKRSCPFFENRDLGVEQGADWEVCYKESVEDRLSRQQTNISTLTGILNKMKNPKLPLLELLHTICERFPPILFHPEENGRPMAFHLSCPCERTQAVTHLGFLLLEMVESGVKSAEQQVDTVFIGCLEEPWLSALESRVKRQKRSVRKIEATRFVVTKEEDMENLLSLQQNCKRMTIREVVVQRGLDEEGDLRRHSQDFWAQMARGLKLDNLCVHRVGATRSDLLGGRREDIRAIWDALAVDADAWGFSTFDVAEVPFPVSTTLRHWWNSEEKKEKEWSDFQLILDTEPKLWPKRFKRELDLSTDEDSSDD